MIGRKSRTQFETTKAFLNCPERLSVTCFLQDKVKSYVIQISQGHEKIPVNEAPWPCRSLRAAVVPILKGPAPEQCVMA